LRISFPSISLSKPTVTRVHPPGPGAGAGFVGIEPLVGDDTEGKVPLVGGDTGGCGIVGVPNVGGDCVGEVPVGGETLVGCNTIGVGAVPDGGPTLVGGQNVTEVTAPLLANTTLIHFTFSSSISTI
jgi:hypothetical protein